MHTDKIVVGITIGDVAGIGPEVVIKALSDERVLKMFTPVIFCNPRIISFYRKSMDIQKFQYTTIRDFAKITHNSINIFSPWEEEFNIEPGLPSPETGKYAFLSIKAACEALHEHHIDVLVTAPINKNFIQSEDFKFNGHTEYITDYFGCNESLMFMVSDELKVGLVTNHVPVAEVGKLLNIPDIIKKLAIMDTSLREDFAISKPKIAVLSLNPHAGDGGLIGKEELEVIKPAIEQAQIQQILAFGPYGADGFFGSGMYKNFDAVLAMYHDQGLVPFKTINFGEGTNYTAGLPIVRTSPDHGTAEDIAGKNLASPDGMLCAIYRALDIYRNQIEYFEARKNPLQKTHLKSEY